MEIPIKKVLLVDDEPANNYIHKLILENKGVAVEIITLESAKEALDYLKENIPDLILLDLNMPAISGWDFLKAYSENFSHRNKTSVVILSASEDPKDQDKARLDANVMAYLTKPLSVDNLVDAISN